MEIYTYSPGRFVTEKNKSISINHLLNILLKTSDGNYKFGLNLQGKCKATFYHITCFNFIKKRVFTINLLMCISKPKGCQTTCRMLRVIPLVLVWLC